MWDLSRWGIEPVKWTQNTYWKEWCWSSNNSATWCKEPTHWKRPWCWERLKAAGGEGDNRGWHHWLNGHEFEQIPGDGKGQGSLACCSPWGHKVSDMTQRLNNSPCVGWWILIHFTTREILLQILWKHNCSLGCSSTFPKYIVTKRTSFLRITFYSMQSIYQILSIWCFLKSCKARSTLPLFCKWENLGSEERCILPKAFQLLMQS